MANATVLLAGVQCAGYAVIALFFLRFWKASRDRLFLYFAAAFGLLMIQRASLGLFAADDRGTLVFYLLRLVAFLLILVAILDKNRQA